MQPLLADPSLDPGRSDLRRTFDHFREMLRIRRSSPLFRLRTGDEVKTHLRFHNTGPGQIPGLVVMGLWDPLGEVDEEHELIVALFNAGDDSVDFHLSESAGLDLELHPEQKGSRDPLVRTSTFDPSTGRFQVPARTTAVFWAEADEDSDSDSDSDSDH